MDIGTLRKENGDYRICRRFDALMALKEDHVTHLSRMVDGTPRTVGMRKGGDSLGYEYSVVFDAGHGVPQSSRTFTGLALACDAVVDFLNQGAHDYAANDGLTYFSNQARRDATVLAVIDNEIMIEYEMPAGSSSLVRCNVRFGDLRERTNYSYHKVPQKWLRAIRDADMTNWIGMGQRSRTRIPFPLEVVITPGLTVREV